MSLDVETVLRLAIARDPVATMAELGISQARVTQMALHLLDDPAAHLEHPDLAATLKSRLDAGRRARRWR